ncbi:flippase [Aquibacillus kalidii]|uniref:flippase n=1 Tax=Aquibacillus kalidii TaxID=2762597 RepID=UPI001647CE73|nr:flippase [Aquibacillus kalidii]
MNIKNSLYRVLNRLSSNQTFKKILSNTSWLFLERVLRMIVGLFVGIWVARYLGPDDYGLLGYAQAFVLIFSSFATLGLDGIVVRNVVRSPEKKDEILGTAFLLKLVGGIAVAIISVTLGLIVHSDEKVTVWLIGIISFGMIFKSLDVVDFWFQSQVISKYVAYSRGFAFIFTSLLKILGIVLNQPLAFFAIVTMLEMILIALFLVIWYKKSGDIQAWSYSKITAISLLKDSWPLIFSGLVITIYMKTDQIMLRQILGDSAVGQYTAALRLSESWYIIPTVLVTTVAPYLTNAKNSQNKDAYNYYNLLLYRVVVLSAVLIALPMTFLSDWLISLLYGSEYHSAGEVLSIHIWSAVFVFLGVARNPYIVNENLTKYSFITNSGGAVINLVLNAILIPKYGIVGAAYATLISQAVASYLMHVFFSKVRPIFIMQTKALFTFYILKKFSK